MWPVWSAGPSRSPAPSRSEEHTSELQSQSNLVCRLLLEKKKIINDLRRPWPETRSPTLILVHDIYGDCIAVAFRSEVNRHHAPVSLRVDQCTPHPTHTRS